jgi:hypothetical protein
VLLNARKETFAFGGDGGVARIHQKGIGIHDGQGFLASKGHEVLIENVGDAQHGLIAALRCAEYIPFVSYLQVDFRQPKTVPGRFDSREALSRPVGI